MSDAYSVVIPAFNAAAFIDEAVASTLNQTVAPAEVIVVDDGSADDTAQVAARHGPKVRVIRTENRGSGAATSRGVAEATTPIIATLDADDRWWPTKMARQLAVLNDPGIAADVVFTRMQPFGDTHLKSTAVDASGFSRSVMVIRRATFQQVGDVQDLGNGFGEMVDWLARAKTLGLNFHLIDEVLADRRIHKESWSFRGGEGQKQDYLRAAIRALERKKKAR